MKTYLIFSNTINQLNNTLKSIIKDRTYDQFDATDIELKTIIEESSYTSLFSEERIIVIKNCNYFGTTKTKQEDLDIIEKYLKDPNDSLTLIFTTNQKIDARKKNAKTIKAQGNLIECPILNAQETTNYIIDYFKKEGYKINQETAHYISISTQSNLDLIINECQKICIYYQKPCQINLEDVRQIVSINLESNNFKFVDAVINKQMKLAFKIYQDLKIQKVEPIMLLSLLAREYRLIYLCSLFTKKRLSNFEISKKLSLQTWQIDKYKAQVNNFTLKQLESIIKELAETDYSIKKGQLNKNLAVELFILKNA